MKKKIIICLTIAIMFIGSNVYAVGETVTGKLGAGGSYSTSNKNLLGDYYKYIRIEFTPDKDAKYYVSLIGANSVSGLGSASPINPSIELSAKAGQTRIIYILPRSGMGCPKDANYCFGTGTSMSKTTVVQGDECNGHLCNIYGLRIKNKRTFTSYGFTMKYEFFKN